jgi:hypothetical protein
LKAVLILPLEARAAIAASLLESLDREVEAGAYEEWEREIQKRIAEVEAGTTKTISSTVARERLMSHLRDPSVSSLSPACAVPGLPPHYLGVETSKMAHPL